jgi:hypothetical protein
MGFSSFMGARLGELRSRVELRGVPEGNGSERGEKTSPGVNYGFWWIILCYVKGDIINVLTLILAHFPKS